jgi:hypothetical protein
MQAILSTSVNKLMSDHSFTRNSTNAYYKKGINPLKTAVYLNNIQNQFVLHKNTLSPFQITKCQCFVGNFYMVHSVHYSSVPTISSNQWTQLSFISVPPNTCNISTRCSSVLYNNSVCHTHTLVYTEETHQFLHRYNRFKYYPVNISTNNN